MTGLPGLIHMTALCGALLISLSVSSTYVLRDLAMVSDACIAVACGATFIYFCHEFRFHASLPSPMLISLPREPLAGQLPQSEFYQPGSYLNTKSCGYTTTVNVLKVNLNK